MDRKAFLQVCGGVAATGLMSKVAFGATPQARAAATAGKTTPSYAWQFYGTSDGKIYHRLTQNDAWTLHTDLGPECGVYSIYQSGKDVMVDVNGKGQRFTLKLTPNGLHWTSATSH